MVVTKLGTETFNTNSGSHTVTATPAVGDLIIIIVANTGSTSSVAPTDNNSDGKGAYVLINSAVKAASVDTMRVYARKALIGSATSTVFTQAPGTTTGGGIVVLKVTGMTQFGAAAVRQSAIQSNQAAAGTPTPVFANAVLTADAVIGAVFNATSPATMTPRSSPSYTERADVGYATPTTGLEVMSIDSGETGTSMAWGGTSGSAFCSIVIELWNNVPPTTALNTPADAAVGQSSTPTVNFTGTDADANSIEYQVQIDTTTKFNSVSGLVDNFDQITLNTGLWTQFTAGGATMVYDATGASVVYPVATTSSTDGDISSVGTFNLTGAAATMQVLAVPNSGAPVNTDAQLRLGTSTNALKFLCEGGQLYAQQIVGGSSSNLYNEAYNASNHLWWRIRESGGTTFWETSPDGINWLPFFSKANPITVTALGVLIAGTAFGNSTSPGSFKFNNFSFAPVPLITKLSASDVGFTAGHPFASAAAKDYTVQSALTAGLYYWRVRAIDPTGSNMYGAWSATRSFFSGAGVKKVGGLTYATVKKITELAIASVKKIGGVQ